MASIKEMLKQSSKVQNHPLYKTRPASSKKDEHSSQVVHLLNTKVQSQNTFAGPSKETDSARSYGLKSPNYSSGKMLSPNRELIGQILKRDTKQAPKNNIFNFSRTMSSSEFSPNNNNRSLSPFKSKVGFIMMNSKLRKNLDDMKTSPGNSINTSETINDDLRKVLMEFPKTDRNINNEKIMKCIMGALRKPIEERSEVEAAFLRKTMKKMNFFRNIRREVDKLIFKTLFKIIRHEYVPKHKIIYNYGEPSRKAYFILEGEAMELLPKNLKRRNSQVSNEVTIDPKEEESLKETFPNMILNRILKKGEDFGTGALALKGKRESTLVAKENMHCAILMGDVYRKLLDDHVKQIQMEKIEFLRNMPIFEKWSNANINILLYYCEEKTFPKNTILYKEGDPSSYVFFIREGEVELSKRVLKEVKEDADPENMDEIYKMSKDLDRIEYNRFNKIWQEKAAAKTVKRVQVARLGRGQYFGDFEINNEMAHRDSKAQCVTSSVTVYRIKKEKLLDQYKSLGNMTDLKQVTNLKSNWHGEFLSQASGINSEEIFHDVLIQKQVASFKKQQPQKMKISTPALTPRDLEEQNTERETANMKEKELNSSFHEYKNIMHNKALFTLENETGVFSVPQSAIRGKLISPFSEKVERAESEDKSGLFIRNIEGGSAIHIIEDEEPENELDWEEKKQSDINNGFPLERKNSAPESKGKLAVRIRAPQSAKVITKQYGVELNKGEELLPDRKNSPRLEELYSKKVVMKQNYNLEKNASIKSLEEGKLKIFDSGSAVVNKHRINLIKLKMQSSTDRSTKKAAISRPVSAIPFENNNKQNSSTAFAIHNFSCAADCKAMDVEKVLLFKRLNVDKLFPASEYAMEMSKIIQRTQSPVSRPKSASSLKKNLTSFQKYELQKRKVHI